MERNLYFTYWIKRYGIDNFKTITHKVCSKAIIPEEIKKAPDYNSNVYLFHYFWMVYCIVSYHHLGLNTKQISMCLDLSVAPGTCKMYNPTEILEIQKDNIPYMLEFIKKDLELYSKNT